MTDTSPSTADVRIWDIETMKGARTTRYRVRWRTSSKRHVRTLATRKLADTFRSSLVSATRAGTPFDITSGLPVTMLEAIEASAPAITWLDHATAYVDAKWTTASPRHRKGIAEALANVTVALSPQSPARPDARTLRTVLRHHAFNPSTREAPLTPDVQVALDWLRAHSRPVADLADPKVARQALEAISTTLDGRPAQPSTVARKRATLTNALHFAVEQGHLTTNPLDGIRTAHRFQTTVVSRQAVVNPRQARVLLDAVRHNDPAHHAFFAVLYYAGLRPAEARALTVSDCTLPTSGWGKADLRGSRQSSGAAWTDDGAAEEQRSLKHRADSEVRTVPLHPDLVAILRAHLAKFETGVDGLLFVTRTGKAGRPLPPPYANAVSMKSIYRAWSAARQEALSPREYDSALAKRPYDLRHACLSTWLNAGVPAAQVAEWAGHSTQVLLRVYAKCIDGGAESAMRRIEESMIDSDEA
ncbi:tyrosine-type recombinase/integrase [Nocardioides zeae]|uniref:Tyrosine-type recombinase/integrase n=1 Tax=Nocardioides imazamoxiresistens TaxID=3231893 RepID=A0ABU3Q069_9ACTN|nr:tyrosine-type recombinase/integrase [Nocardioides zeae]MDT9594864.1 tyrosine-type recombinase/integrase [Nocardioides zeae]